MAHPKVAALAARKAKHEADFERDIDRLIAAYDDLDRKKDAALAAHHAAIDQREADLVASVGNVADLAGLPVGNERDAGDTQKKT